jgi:hypothetical protein
MGGTEHLAGFVQHDLHVPGVLAELTGQGGGPLAGDNGRQRA